LAIQRLIQSVSPSHGRLLVYVWAIEQDELSKRKVIEDEEPPPLTGKDVVVPWVLSKELGMQEKQPSDKDKEPQIFNRYYHMFAKGELPGLVMEVAKELGLRVGPKPENGNENLKGIEIVQDGWERSNYYVELRLWRTS
jgi:tRNA (uracil-5-)-methyltransferase TRM9